MKTKRLCSIIMIAVMLVTLIVPMAATPVSAATNANTSFTGGKLIKVGNYYFSTTWIAQKNKYYIFRTNLNGTGTKAIGGGLNVSDVYGYKNIAYFSIDGKIYSHDTKTLKSAALKKTDQKVRGISTAGLITSNDNTNAALYLLSFRGVFKKIAASSNSFLAANSQYIFYTQAVSKSGRSIPNETDRVIRYTIKSGATKKMGTFTVMSSPYEGSYARCFDNHVFKNSIVFLYGHREGSAAIYYGSAFSMKADGTGIKKLRDDVGPVITPGKGCVFVADSNKISGKINVYKISEAGKLSVYVKNTNYDYTTAGGYRLNSVSNGKSSYNMYLGTAGSGSNGKLALNGTKLIKSSDPSDAYAICSAIGAVGNVALVNVNIYTYQGGIGWRARNLRTYLYLLNTRTAKLYRMV